MERAHESRGVDLFKVLKPKQMVQKKKGNFIKPLPGLQDADGVWQKSAREIAVAWQKQFGAIEHAEEVTFDQLLARSEPSCQPIEGEQLGQVPTLYDVEAAIRTLNCDKAPGLDNLGTELFQLDVSHAAQRLFALHLKTALRKQNVPELTGGWLLPLHKKKGSPAHMPAYRAIMLEPTVARMLSRAWRPKLTEGITKVAQPLQYGGRRGLGIEALHLQVRLWQSTARHEKLSLGLVFIDIQAAFYSVIKPMLATVKDTTDSLSQVFSKLNLPSSAYQEFLQSVGSGQLIYEATGSSLLSEGTAATLSHTWFVVPQGTQVLAPATGSRPGDPNADVLFSFIMAKLLKEIRQRAALEGLDLTEWAEEGPVSKHLSWVDDLTFAITGDARQLVQRVTHRCR